MLENGLLFALLLSFLLTVFISPVFIPFLRRLKFGQSIRDVGPESHHKKTGTPTMGGLMIIFSALIATLVIAGQFQGLTVEIWLLLLVMLGFGLLGFMDDFIKVVKKRNLGLTSKQKFLGQVVISAIVYVVLLQTGLSTEIIVPGTGWSVDIGWLYLPLIIIMLVGTSNAVNLTDGLDGLVAGTGAIAFTAFAVLAGFTELWTVAIFSLAVAGALLGFLVFNAYPAKVFMGDTGSLALGGVLALIAVFTKTELLLILIGGVFVIETLSVIMQVASFKIRKKRIFKMSPIHHHFELTGWSEWRVVLTFWAAGLLFALTGIWLEVG
ncbi:phospho-N-acetylmuramoyl-pentapeptide-transferase [Alkalicoccus daliensis]|uniref:Phospho-N-acetylmuramoyl-pentapeptide-transferase n=1 Tax=Alkalicoccus daliensis TaxID=745820 RepID=A0A1G9ZWS4_9BACI|nr:phospho-N-acetylmuramoyl-pentapeptide-transferase [Alkalicoccus daliensis]SDN25016.1 Phospho-N-acetylmuramoyl-pentapeptide-transferase [Alkalicoccus daliensis]